MKQTIVSGEERPLLTYARSKLNPDVFSHPVWVRFGNKNTAVPPATYQKLYTQTEQLQRDSPGDACQVLLICAVYQIYSGRLDHALRATQQALALAERNRLSREIIWATWGACAICYQAAKYEQAIRYLEYLQSELHEQKDWILVDFVEMVKQDLLNPNSTDQDQPYVIAVEKSDDDLLHLTLNWLRHWGIARVPSSCVPGTQQKQQENRVFPPDRFSGPFLTNLVKQKNWSSFLSSLRSLVSRQQICSQNNTGLSHAQTTSTLSSAVEEHDRTTLSDDSRTATKENDDDRCTTGISTVVQMLGSFRMTVQDSAIRLPASRGLSLFKYLLLHHKQDTPREVLMDVFWPDLDADAARNNLNVAMHNLRQGLRSLTDTAMIRFEEGAYGPSNDLDIWLDVEEFERYIKAGRQLEALNQLTAALTKYEFAVDLYQGDFLADSPYEDWTLVDRERLQILYRDALDHISQIYFSQERYTACIGQCQLLLNHDPCREHVHCRLMQCYSRLGQAPLAMRQYQICTEALRDELDVDPARETIQLYEQIRHREAV